MKYSASVFASFLIGAAVTLGYAIAFLIPLPAVPPSQDKELADRWRFVETLRGLGGLCHYRLLYSPTIGLPAVRIWEMQLRGGGWEGSSYGPLQLPAGITFRIREEESLCKDFLKKAFMENYRSYAYSLAKNESNTFLNACGSECVQIELNYIRSEPR